LIGTAANGEEAVRAAVMLHPDVLVMDIQMPGLSGIDATSEIGRVAPDVAVLMLTMFDDDESVFAAMRAGAQGYVLKGAAPDNVIRAIAAVAAGEAIFGPEIARRVIAHFSTGVGSAKQAFPGLTDREREILEKIAGGRGNATIAHELNISLKTVRNHVSNIFTKLQVSDRSAAIVKAREAGIATPSEGH